MHGGSVCARRDVAVVSVLKKDVGLPTSQIIEMSGTGMRNEQVEAAATYYLLLTTYNLQLTTYYLLLTTYYLLLTTYYLLLTT